MMLRVNPAALREVNRGLGSLLCPNPSGAAVFSLTSAFTSAVLPPPSLPARVIRFGTLVLRGHVLEAWAAMTREQLCLLPNVGGPVVPSSLPAWRARHERQGLGCDDKSQVWLATRHGGSMVPFSTEPPNLHAFLSCPSVPALSASAALGSEVHGHALVHSCL